MNPQILVCSLFNGSDIFFHDIAWNQLEEEKPEIFKDFYTKLILEEPSSTSNQLLEQQNDLENFLACLDDPLAFIEEDFQHIPGKFLAINILLCSKYNRFNNIKLASG
jgi:hypothetical protein